MKKALLLIMVLMLVLSPLQGVSAFDSMSVFESADRLAREIPEGIEVVSEGNVNVIAKDAALDEAVTSRLGHYYTELDEGSQIIYETIAEGFAEGSTKSYIGIYLSCEPGDSNAINEELDAFAWWMMDIMYLYALDNPQDTEFSGAYMEVSQDYNAQYHAGDFCMAYQPHPYYKSSYKTNRDKFINNVVTEANKLSGSYAKIKYAYDAVIEAAEFDVDSTYYTDTSAEEYFFANSSFGITEKGKSGYAGYAKLFMQILDKLGYENTFAMNDSAIWNIVRIGAEWYVVDCVMGDMAKTDMYFLAPVFDSIHEPDFYLYAPPTATHYYYESGHQRMIYLKCDNLYVGEKISNFYVPGSSRISVRSAQWAEENSDTPLSSTDEFEAGKIYEYTSVLGAFSDSKFEGELKAWVYGASDIVVNTSVSEDGSTAEISFRIQVPEKVESVKLPIKSPIPGKALPGADISTADGIMITEEIWMDAETGEFATDVIAGRGYIYAVSVQASQGYAICNDAFINVSGIEWEESLTQMQSVAGTNALTFAGLMIATEHTHKEVIIPGKDASCTEDGLTDGKVCETCGEVLKEQTVIPGGHTLKVKVEGNIKSTGCTKCDYEESHELNEEELAFFGLGDINYDGIINSSDLSNLLSAYGTTNKNADMNSDGLVNSSDLSELLSNYGKAL